MQTQRNEEAVAAEADFPTLDHAVEVLEEAAEALAEEGTSLVRKTCLMRSLAVGWAAWAGGAAWVRGLLVGMVCL